MARVFSPERPTTTTRSPARVRVRAAAAPMPSLAPVITMVRWVKGCPLVGVGTWRYGWTAASLAWGPGARVGPSGTSLASRINDAVIGIVPGDGPPHLQRLGRGGELTGSRDRQIGA